MSKYVPTEVLRTPTVELTAEVVELAAARVELTAASEVTCGFRGEMGVSECAVTAKLCDVECHA